MSRMMRGFSHSSREGVNESVSSTELTALRTAQRNQQRLITDAIVKSHFDELLRLVKATAA